MNCTDVSVKKQRSTIFHYLHSFEKYLLKDVIFIENFRKLELPFVPDKILVGSA